MIQRVPLSESGRGAGVEGGRRANADASVDLGGRGWPISLISRLWVSPARVSSDCLSPGRPPRRWKVRTGTRNYRKWLDVF